MAGQTVGTGTNSPSTQFTNGSAQAARNISDQTTESQLALMETQIKQSSKFDNLSQVGNAVQFAAKTNSYGWALLNKVMDSAFKGLG